ncbi:MAG TPA: hypothetical protein VIK55_09435 [Paludibacter sp.]
MKKITFTITLSVFLMIGAYNSVFSQTETTPELTKFLILVETTDDGIKLTGQQGCAFKELTFTLKADKSQAIDQFGMTSKEESKGSGFLFTIKKTKDGLSFEGLKGTYFKKLSFSCPKGNCHQAIDQRGMTEVK